MQLLTTLLVCSLYLLPNLAAALTPHIYDVPQVGPPTSTSQVFGIGFDPNATVDVYFDTADVGVVVTDSSGSIGMASRALTLRQSGLTIQIPADAVPGTHTITAVERITKLQAQVPFTVRTDWPQFQFDAQHTGLNPYENVLSPETVGNLTIRWTYPTGQYSSLTGSPMVTNGSVYVSADNVADGSFPFFALNADTGALLWNITPSPSIAMPAVFNGVVYACGGGQGWGGVFALNASSGAHIWYTPLPDKSHDCAPTFKDGVLYVNSGGVVALNASTGAVQWRWDLTSYINGSPAVANGLVYVAAVDNNVYAINAATGALVWKYATGDPVWSVPTVANGMVYVSSNDYNVYAINAATGALVWKYAAGGTTFDVIVANGVAYVASDALYALDAATGSLLYKTDWAPISVPTVANGVLYVGSGFNVYAVDASTGALLWSYPTGSWVEVAPAVVDGLVYVGSQDGNLYAFGLPNQQMSEKFSPPKRLDPARLAPDWNLQPSQVVAPYKK
jgi:glucose dehydrogenase